MNLNTLTLIGGFILLVSWVVQSTLYDYWDQRLSALERAESIYIACLSSTFTMNAIQEIAPKGKSLGIWNNENFRLGLTYMLKGLSDAGQNRWSKNLEKAQDADLNQVGAGLMEEVSSQQTLIVRWKARSRWLFIMSYIAGSIIVVAAESLKHGR